MKNKEFSQSSLQILLKIMRNFIYALIPILAAGIFAFGQNNNDSTCPSIVVSGPSEVLEPNASATYTVNINPREKHPNLQFLWSASAGEIISGQGTETIIIKQPNPTITVTVDVRGLPNNCQNSASETSCDLGPPAAVKLDEYSGTFSKIDKTRFEEISQVVQNDPTTQLYIVIKYKGNIQQEKIDQRESEIKNELVKAGVEEGRITFVRGSAKADLLELWLVPAGGTPPKP